MKLRRQSGILLHPSSLPGPYGIGDLGPEAYRFVDFLAETGQSLWQVLPLGPTGPGNSPYFLPSAFAGNPLLISPDFLRQDGLLNDVGQVPDFNQDSVDYGGVIPYKRWLLDEAFKTFQGGRGGAFARLEADFKAWTSKNFGWLDDYALFRALKDRDESRVWDGWEPELKHRNPRALREARNAHWDNIEKHRFVQFLFYRQWAALREYCRQRRVALVGDVPIFVAYDSADVWAHPELFKLDAELKPTAVSGVPPDYFSPEGQLWNTPLYNWAKMEETGFTWWIDRIRNLLSIVDYLRLDHFRGFAACWEVPFGDPTAEFGRWVPTPGKALFTVVGEALGSDLPVLAEDLGLITPDVHALRDGFGFPGMRILQFAFSSDGRVDEFLPYNYVRHTVSYTGTHDNDTTQGWFRSENEACRRACFEYFNPFGGDFGEFERNVHWVFIKTVMASVASITLVPLQDVLGLGPEARMNYPSSGEDRWWRWRFHWEGLNDELRGRLQKVTELYGRSVPKFPY
ncbi:MAG: 4-alpha-glucanotransferase [Candidatus Xenobia bacterium]